MNQPATPSAATLAVARALYPHGPAHYAYLTNEQNDAARARDWQVIAAKIGAVPEFAALNAQSTQAPGLPSPVVAPVSGGVARDMGHLALIVLGHLIADMEETGCIDHYDSEKGAGVGGAVDEARAVLAGRVPPGFKVAPVSNDMREALAQCITEPGALAERSHAYALDHSRSTFTRKVLTLNGRAIGELWADDADDTVKRLNAQPEPAKPDAKTAALKTVEAEPVTLLPRLHGPFAANMRTLIELVRKALKD